MASIITQEKINMDYLIPQQLWNFSKKNKGFGQ